MIRVTIDSESGFCFGVVTAIRKAEEELAKGGTLYCLGDIVHNEREVERLAGLGLITINHEEYKQLHNAKVLLRAHGEPPETYRIAQENNIEIIDASCPVVRHLQQRIKKQYETQPDGQIVIFGKQGHAEVIGLQGQTENTAIVVENEADLEKIDYTKPIYLVSQTTKSVDEFKHLAEEIKVRNSETQKLRDSKKETFVYHDTICKQVRNRVQHIREFAKAHDRILFVGGHNSSNGKVLYSHCKEANPDTTFVGDASEITAEYIAACEGKTVGICGATSTPLWLMEECEAVLRGQRTKDKRYKTKVTKLFSYSDTVKKQQ